MVPGVRFDALVLLGCRVSATGLSGPAERRVARLLAAYQDGLAPSVVVSGGRAWHGTVEADALARALEAGGVPREAMLLERESRNTHENALFSARLARALHIEKVGVVTCDWHLPRALFCFRRAGFDATGLGAPSPDLPAGRRLFRGLRERGAWLIDRAVARGW